MLSLGFLTKGFVAFFPWTFPFLLWLFFKQKSFVKMIFDSAAIFVFTITPLVLLILFSPVASLSLHKYIDNQVIESLKNAVNVSSRFDILKRLLSELAPAAGLVIILLFRAWIRKSPVFLIKESSKKALVFVLLGLTGVLPIMISMKQSGFYIIPAYPFFAIGTGILMYPLIDSLFMNINFNSKGFLFFQFVGLGLVLAGTILSIYFSDHYSRDKDKIKDISVILKEIPQGTIINISPDMYSDWSLHAYFGRFKNISLDPDLNNKRNYLLIKNEYYSDTLNSNYISIKLNAIDYQLFKKNK
jgi:hypothetical protein